MYYHRLKKNLIVVSVLDLFDKIKCSIAAVSYFFNSGFLLGSWNSTAISLIPKVAAPSTVRDYRPIACCNVPYKCISKVLANRIQSTLPSIVGYNQSAFINGRSIKDNIPLMQEMVRGYHKDNG